MSTRPLDIANVQAQLGKHLVARGWHDDSATLSLLAHGEANLIFRLGESALVRVAVNTPNKRFGGDFRRVTEFEQLILTYLKGSGIGHELQASQLTPSDDFPYTYLITNFLPGGALDYGQTHLRQCAETLAQLHRLPAVRSYELDSVRSQLPLITQPLTVFFEEARDYAQPYLDSPDAEPEVVEMLRSALAKAEQRLSAEHLLSDYPHLCLVHGDHTYENWVINEQRAHLIDWEWAEVGSPAGDLGHFLSPVTVRRRQGYHLPKGDRDYFLQCYYDALEDADLAHRIARHFAAFGPFPALRSFCWTAGYWITANRWYADSEDSPSAAERMNRLQQSRQQFPGFWQELMDWFEEPM
ncbi:MAG: phosphotransferase [Cyanobacteria bacterium J06638_22]